MTERYHVRIRKESLVFSAAHFITFAGDICERLHGHNYGLAAEVSGPLDENHYVVDFILLRDTLRSIADELDHYVLLPTQHPLIRVTPGEHEVQATFRERRWIFPRGDCMLLPVANTTAEKLAEWIGHRLLERLAAQGVRRPERVAIEVDECCGQAGVWELSSAS